MSAPQSVQFYLDLFTSQYQGSPKLLKWAQVVLQYFDDCFACLNTFDKSFDLFTAVGAQLDILGTIVGVGRTVSFQPTVGSPTLGDDDYRLLVKARIAFNQWNGKIDSLQAIWLQLFPSGNIAVIDGQNMSMTVALGGLFTSMQADLIRNGYIVPRPEGVLINYIFNDVPYFGFDSSSLIAGFDTGHWI